MNFYSNFAQNKNSNLKLIENSLTAVFLKLKELNLISLNISDYNKKYLGDHVKDFQKTAWFLSHIFMLVNEKGKSFSDLTILDYGGGSGVLSFFAKELGIGTVIYNDIYDVSCTDVKVISKALNVTIDYIIPGDISNVVAFIKDKKIEVDFVLAHDVIEHIYNVNQWYADLKEILVPQSTVICTSHANKYNPLIRHKLETLQINAEINSQKKQWGHKERDSLESFYDIRKLLIKEQAPQLEQNEVADLATATRGLMNMDIKLAVNDYISEGKITVKPSNRKNTCDPNTGNWIEQLIDLNQLSIKLNELGYQNKITAGFYISSKGNFIVKMLKKTANYGIYFLKKNGLYLSPYYVVTSQLNKI